MQPFTSMSLWKKNHKKNIDKCLSPLSLLWGFSNHSVQSTRGRCFLPGGDSCLKRVLLKYLKLLSEEAVTFRCRQNKPGGLEHPTGGVAESWACTECLKTQNYSPPQVGGRNWERIFKYIPVKSQPLQLQFFSFLQLSWQWKTKPCTARIHTIIFFKNHVPVHIPLRCSFSRRSRMVSVGSVYSKQAFWNVSADDMLQNIGIA